MDGPRGSLNYVQDQPIVIAEAIVAVDRPVGARGTAWMLVRGVALDRIAG